MKMSATETRVLIIENNDAVRVILFTVLRHQPLGVDTATTASEALKKVRSCDYALIILDMNLPDGESQEFLQRFREFRPQSTTFVLGVRDPRVEIDIDPGQVNAIANKPVEIDTLADVVRECALVIPPPENPLPCPPAESELRAQRDPDSSWPN